MFNYYILPQGAHRDVLVSTVSNLAIAVTNNHAIDSQARAIAKRVLEEYDAKYRALLVDTDAIVSECAAVKTALLATP